MQLSSSNNNAITFKKATKSSKKNAKKDYNLSILTTKSNIINNSKKKNVKLKSKQKIESKLDYLLKL